MVHKKILIAGDTSIGGMLEYAAKRKGAGYETAVVEDGLEALRKAEEWLPDFIFITGTMIPGLDGWSLCEAIHTNPRLRGVKIILSSGYETTSVAGSALLAGAFEFLPKPYDHKDIFKIIEGSPE